MVSSLVVDYNLAVIQMQRRMGRCVQVSFKANSFFGMTLLSVSTKLMPVSLGVLYLQKTLQRVKCHDIIALGVTYFPCGWLNGLNNTLLLSESPHPQA